MTNWLATNWQPALVLYFVGFFTAWLADAYLRRRLYKALNTYVSFLKSRGEG